MKFQDDSSNKRTDAQAETNIRGSHTLNGVPLKSVKYWLKTQ